MIDGYIPTTTPGESSTANVLLLKQLASSHLATTSRTLLLS